MNNIDALSEEILTDAVFCILSLAVLFIFIALFLTAPIWGIPYAIYKWSKK